MIVNGLSQVDWFRFCQLKREGDDIKKEELDVMAGCVSTTHPTIPYREPMILFGYLSSRFFFVLYVYLLIFFLFFFLISFFFCTVSDSVCVSYKYVAVYFLSKGVPS